MASFPCVFGAIRVVMTTRILEIKTVYSHFVLSTVFDYPGSCNFHWKAVRECRNYNCLFTVLERSTSSPGGFSLNLRERILLHRLNVLVISVLHWILANFDNPVFYSLSTQHFRLDEVRRIQILLFLGWGHRIHDDHLNNEFLSDCHCFLSSIGYRKTTTPRYRASGRVVAYNPYNYGELLQNQSFIPLNDERYATSNFIALNRRNRWRQTQDVLSPPSTRLKGTSALASKKNIQSSKERRGD
ncbi:unnamed protein product [Albugo candida]|uniref:Uncharacterized protein n=1 Tax=Albugo candida TaxID=65357 RepID=A0A024FW33_9STRA|nr:unnamed protein product [Albugo candida]|eukprot:CCI11246.1 unnamed protein product [Albugo candida]